MIQFKPFRIYFYPKYEFFWRILEIEGILFLRVDSIDQAQIVFGWEQANCISPFRNKVIFELDATADLDGAEILFSEKSDVLEGELKISKKQFGSVTRIVCNKDITRLISRNSIVKTPISIKDRIAFEPLVEKNFYLFDTLSCLICHITLANYYSGYPVFSRYPYGSTNIFCFRIDIDPDRSVGEDEALRRIEITARHFREYSAFTSIALNIYRYQNCLQHVCDLFRDYTDVCSHGFYHHPYLSKSHATIDFNRSIKLMNDSGLHCRGIIFPEYFYKEGIFSRLEYDGLAYMSSFGKSFSGQYQIEDDAIIDFPCCPLTLSRMESVGITRDSEKISVYKDVVTSYITNPFIPCILYEHPQRLHRNLPVLDELFRFVREQDVFLITLNDFSNWIRKRQNLMESIRLKDWFYHSDYNEGEFPIQWCGPNAPVNIKELDHRLFANAAKHALEIGDKSLTDSKYRARKVKFSLKHLRKFVSSLSNWWAIS